MPKDALQDLIDAWPGEEVVSRHDDATGARLFIAIHSSRLGPPTGGTRLKSYPAPEAALRDAMRLAEGMTLKWAVLGVARGGGKGVIAVPEGLGGAGLEGLLKRYGRLVESLAGRFETGPDMGTGPEEMDLIAGETTHVFGKSVARGGAGDPGPYTARGVLAGIRAACRHVFGTASLDGRSVLVQGVGHVGAPLVRLLIRERARVLVSDTDPARLLALKEPAARAVPPDRAIEEPVDVLAPCAAGGILRAESIPRLRCRIVAGAANSQLDTPADADRLREAGILYAPDYVINAGGAIFLPQREGLGRPIAEIEAQCDAIGDTLRECFRVADHEGLSTDRAARRLAEARLG